MAEIFNEINEEVRREQYLKLWQKYGRYLIAAVVLFLLIVAGVTGWQTYQKKQRLENGQRYEAALELVSAGKSTAAAAAFARLGTDGSGGYAAMARLREAALLTAKGDDKGATRIYERLAADNDTDRMFRDLAVELMVFHELKRGNPAALIARLAPITAEDNPWRYSALELTALLALRKGDESKARAIFTRLTDDRAAPPAMRRRAGELLSSIGG